MKTLPLSEVKARLSELADEVDRTHERVLATKNGHDYVVVMSVEDLESIEATLELLNDVDAQRRIEIAEEEIAADESLSPSQVRDMLRGGRSG